MKGNVQLSSSGYPDIHFSPVSKMNFAQLYPSRENGIDSLIGGYVLIGQLLIGVLYLTRAKNRQFTLNRLGLSTKKEEPELQPYKMVIIWEAILFHSLLHVCSIFAFYLLISMAKWQTFLWFMVLLECGGFSISGGYHLLYSHRSYKASKLYQIVIMIFSCIMAQHSIIFWARNHRCHHKFMDTDADPHNSKRGLFFSHFGWLLVERHPEVIKQGRKIDVSDLTSNPILVFQRKYYPLLVIIFQLAITVLVPLLWSERVWTSWFCSQLVFCVGLHGVGIVNSWFHYKGTKSYNKNISPVDGKTWQHIISLGSGNHNFHHVFPQDYRCAERNGFFLFTKHIIEFCSWLGLTYDLKVTSQAMIDRAKEKSSFAEGENCY